MTFPEHLLYPTCLSLGDGYVVEWPTEQLRVEAHYIRDSHGDIQAELTWYERGVDKWEKIRGGGRLNLLAPTSIAQAGRHLAEINNPKFPWGFALEKACEMIVETRRAGEPMVRYQEVSKTLPKQKWVIPGLIPEGVTTLIHANWESGKSMLAQAIQLSIATGYPFLGRELSTHGPVLYLDWETDKERWARRMGILMNGMEISQDEPYPLLYRRMGGMIRDQVSRIREIIERNNVIAVVTDSMGWAAGAGAGEDIKEAAPAIAAMEAIRSFRITAVALAHQSKSVANGSQDATTTSYGSVFFEAGARFVWSIKAHRRNESELEMKLNNLKNNDGPHQKELGLRLSFSEDKAWFSQALITSPMSVLNTRILRVLEEAPGTAQEIARILDLNQETVRKACERMVQDNEMLKSGGSKGGSAPLYSLVSLREPVVSTATLVAPVSKQEELVSVPAQEPGVQCMCDLCFEDRWCIKTEAGVWLCGVCQTGD